MNKNKTKISIGGNDYPCRVTMGAMVRFKNETGKDVGAMNASDTAELMLFIFCCVKSACNADKVAFDMDFEMFADLLEPAELVAFYENVGETAQKKTTQKTDAK